MTRLCVNDGRPLPPETAMCDRTNNRNGWGVVGGGQGNGGGLGCRAKVKVEARVEG